MNKRPSKLFYAAAVAAALIALPASAMAQVIDIGTCNTPPGTNLDTDTVAAWQGGNGVSINAQLARFYFVAGVATSDVTAVGVPPYEHWVVIHCNDIYGNVVVSPQVIGYSASSSYTITTWCPLGQVGSASEHWAISDPL